MKPWLGEIGSHLLCVWLLTGDTQTFKCGGRGRRSFGRLAKVAKLELGLLSSSMIDSVGRWTYGQICEPLAYLASLHDSDDDFCRLDQLSLVSSDDAKFMLGSTDMVVARLAIWSAFLWLVQTMPSLCSIWPMWSLPDWLGLG